MSLRSFLFGEPYNKELLELKNFSAEYEVEVKTEMSPELGEDPGGYAMECRYLLDQSIRSDEIVNTIDLKDVIIKTANKSLENSIEDLTAIIKISPSYKVARRFNGEIFEIRNAQVLLRDWENAKTDLIPNLFKTDNERIGFKLSYEKGLLHTHVALKNNWHYLLMLPEIYCFKHYVEPTGPSKTSVHRYKSGLVPEINVDYCMVASTISRNDDVINLKMKSQITNSAHLSTLTINGKKFNTKNYSFRIEVEYEISVSNGKVLVARANLLEKLDEDINKTVILLNLWGDQPGETAKMKLSGNENKWSVFDK